MKGLDAAGFEQGLARFVERRHAQRNPVIRDHIAVEVEAHAEFFRKGVCSIQHRHVAATRDGQRLALGFQPILLGLQRRIEREREALTGIRDWQQLAGAEIEIAAQLFGGLLHIRRSIRRPDDGLRQAGRGERKGEHHNTLVFHGEWRLVRVAE